VASKVRIKETPMQPFLLEKTKLIVSTDREPLLQKGGICSFPCCSWQETSLKGIGSSYPPSTSKRRDISCLYRLPL